MKFCFFGYDHTLDILQRLLEDGHEALCVHTFPCDNFFSYNKDIILFSNHHQIPIKEDKVTEDDIESLIEDGCELFISCGYPYKIPPIDARKAYGVNLHPTYLPLARGIMPQPFVIMHEPEAAGFTLHKLEQAYDTGDILYQERVEIDDTTDVETLSAKIALRTPDAVSKVVKELHEYWQNATPQDDINASYYNQPDDVFRSLDWNNDVDTLLLKGRAFGRFGIIADIENKFGETQKLAVFQFSGWKENHDLSPGTLMRAYPREITVAVKDGYICIKEFQVLQ